MQLHIPESQSEGLIVLSRRTGRSAEELVTEAVDRLLAEERWFDAQVQVGIDQIARGEFLDEEAMDARVAQMMRR
jgi:predicted transcriptional regulator